MFSSKLVRRSLLGLLQLSLLSASFLVFLALDISLSKMTNKILYYTKETIFCNVYKGDFVYSTLLNVMTARVWRKYNNADNEHELWYAGKHGQGRGSRTSYHDVDGKWLYHIGSPYIRMWALWSSRYMINDRAFQNVQWITTFEQDSCS